MKATEARAANRKRVMYYVDGFNLYHGCFQNRNTRGTWRDYKWLNLEAMCARIFPQHDLVGVKYFTANVDPEPDNPHNVTRQQIYHRALAACPNTEIILGRFSVNRAWRRCADSDSPKAIPADPERSVLVLERREKGSDVNLATHLLMDAFKDRYDMAVIISNDSDLALPIQMVKRDFGRDVAIINPRKKLAFDLKNIADVYRSIRRTWLERAQFPDTLHDHLGDFHRPEAWKNERESD